VRFRVYLLRLLRFYQAYCTLIWHYCYVTGAGGVWICFQISRSTGVSIYSHCHKVTYQLLILNLSLSLDKGRKRSSWPTHFSLFQPIEVQLFQLTSFLCDSHFLTIHNQCPVKGGAP